MSEKIAPRYYMNLACVSRALASINNTIILIVLPSAKRWNAYCVTRLSIWLLV